jgi:hypothetical protein
MFFFAFLFAFSLGLNSDLQANPSRNMLVNNVASLAWDWLIYCITPRPPTLSLCGIFKFAAWPQKRENGKKRKSTETTLPSLTVDEHLFTFPVWTRKVRRSA